jgi:hypothetical protein
MLAGGWQAIQLVTVSGALPVCSWKATRMSLPAAQEDALNKATKALAVLSTTGLLPVATALTLKATVCDVLSPDMKSLATTWIW